MLIKSALATGKTTAIERLIAILEARLGRPARVAYITHLSALNANIAQRLKEAGFDFLLYSDFSGKTAQYLAAGDKIVISYNSLPRLQDADGNMPKFDLVVLDEITQLAVYTHANTYRRGQAYKCCGNLDHMLKKAGLTIGLDAHLHNGVCDRFKSIIPDTVILENLYKHDWGDLHIHPTMDGAIFWAIVAIGDEQAKPKSQRMPVIIPCSSRKDSRVIHREIIRQFGKDDVMLVNA